MPGRLTVCPTPIGNMDDVTKRVREALVSADFVACHQFGLLARVDVLETARTGATVGDTGQHEEQIGEAIEIDDDERRQFDLARERHDAAFGATTDNTDGTYAATAADGRVIALLEDGPKRTSSVVVLRPATL